MAGRWSEHEDAYIAAHYGPQPAAAVAVHLGRTIGAVHARARWLNVKRRPYWTPEEDLYLLQHYDTQPASDIGRAIGRSTEAVRRRARALAINWPALQRNNYLLDTPTPGIVTVLLQPGSFALIDAEDLERVARYQWHAAAVGSNTYARAKRAPRPARGDMALHRFIMKAKPGYKIDHRNGNGLDCRKVNLRYYTGSQNHANQRPQLGRSSRFKGVSWQHRSGKWMARIGVHGRTIYLGRYHEETDAARAYDVAAIQAWGDFALVNFPRLAVS